MDGTKYGRAVVLCLIVFFSILWVVVNVGELVVTGCQSASKELYGPVDDSAGYTISAWDLCAEYENNVIAADSKYKGAIVKLSGRVKEIGMKDGTPYLTFDGCDGLICQFPGHFFYVEKSRNMASKLSKGQWVSIKGKVNGVHEGVVSINRCTVNSR